MSPIPTGADHDLAQRLSATGVSVTPGQLIGWRQGGLLGEQRSDGTYERNIVERARAARRLVECNPRKLYVAVLAMFAEAEFSIATEHLRAAYWAALDQVERDLASMAATRTRTEIPFEIADALAKRIAREPRFRDMRDRIPPRGRSQERETRGAIISSVAANLVNATIAGGPISDEANVETLNFIGVAKFAEDFCSDEAIPAETLAGWLTELLGDVQIDDLRAHIETLTTDELAGYRDDAAKAAELMTIRLGDPIDLALGAVAMSLLDRGNHAAYAHFIAVVRETLPDL